MMTTSSEVWSTIEQEVEGAIEHHRKQLLKTAGRIVPNLTADDILQPNDFPELENHPEFRYEEGILAGMLTMQTLLRVAKRQHS